MVLGFLTICSGVVLLQLSKAAKDVPDAAVFTGDLDQMQTIAEQEQPETEPKADAIRGAAAIVRRVSKARMKMEESEFRRLQEERMMDSMEVINESGQSQRPPEYEWDGLRRRRTNTLGSRRPVTASPSQRSTAATPQPPRSPLHPPLGMSHFPDYDEDAADERDHGHDNDNSTIFSSIAGSLMRGRGRARTNATLPTYEEEDNGSDKDRNTSVPLNEVAGSSQSHMHEKDEEAGYGSSSTQQQQQQRRAAFYQQDTAYAGSGTAGRSNKSGNSLKPPTPPQHSARRQFSFNRVWRRSQVPTEEESAGLVEGESDRRPSDEAGTEERQHRGSYD